MPPRRVHNNAKRHIKGSYAYNHRNEAARKRTQEAVVESELDISMVLTEIVSWFMPSWSYESDFSVHRPAETLENTVLDETTSCHYCYHRRTRETTRVKPLLRRSLWR